METPYPSFEFEAVVQKGGIVALPRSISARLKVGKHLIVRITEGDVSHSLRERNITEHDVEHIATMQMEQREHVLRFLKAEGALMNKTAFAKRVAARKRQ